MNAIKKGELLTQNTPAAIPAPIMVPQNHGYGVRQRTDAAGQAQIPITEITNEKNGVGLKPLQEKLIVRPPGAVKISRNRKTEMRQSRCLG